MARPARSAPGAVPAACPHPTPAKLHPRLTPRRCSRPAVQPLLFLERVAPEMVALLGSGRACALAPGQAGTREWLLRRPGVETGLCRSHCPSGWFRGQHGPELVAGLTRGLSVLRAHLVDGRCQTMKTQKTPPQREGDGPAEPWSPGGRRGCRPPSGPRAEQCIPPSCLRPFPLLLSVEQRCVCRPGGFPRRPSLGPGERGGGGRPASCRPPGLLWVPRASVPAPGSPCWLPAHLPSPVLIKSHIY